MKLKKSLLVAGAVASIGLAGVTGVGAASAATNGNGNSDSLIARLAQRFNLKEDDVEAVVKEHRTEMAAERQTERKAELSERLQTAVDDGKLTAEQKTALEAKIQEHQAERQTEHEQMRTWAEEQGIDLSEIMPMGGNRERRGLDN